MKYTVTRKAILIASPGQGSNYLRGVQFDIQGFKSHLCSARGGKWYAHEITVLENPTAEQLLAICQMAEADYLLIYYSGHGYTDYGTGYRMLNCGTQSSIADIALLQGCSPRILLTCDACRPIFGEGIGSIPLPGPDYFDFTGEPSEIRRLFDEYILASTPGKTIIHATKSGKLASDSSHGGVFTQAFLHVAGRMTIEQGIQMVTAEQVLYHVPGLLRERGNNQEPELIYYSGDLRVPFAVALPAPQHVESRRAPLAQTVSQSNGWGELLFGLGLVALAAYISEQ